MGSLRTGGRDEPSAGEAHVSPEGGSFPADHQEDGAILGEFGHSTKTKFFLIREEFDRPRWEPVLQPHTKGQVLFWKPFLPFCQQEKSFKISLKNSLPSPHAPPLPPPSQI